MLKNSTMHSHLKLRAACNKLRCAINDNPDFFANLEIPKSGVCHHQPQNNNARNFGILALASLFLTKILGASH